MQKLELNKMGLAPMNEIEMQEVDGGGWLLKALFCVLVVAFPVVLVTAGTVAGVATFGAAVAVGSSSGSTNPPS